MSKRFNASGLLFFCLSVLAACGTAPIEPELSIGTSSSPTPSSEIIVVKGKPGNSRDIESLRRDYNEAAIVAYVRSTEVLSVGSSDEQTDCVNFGSNRGPGYCSFTMKATVVELYKGKFRSNFIEYAEYGEARLISNRDVFLGEQIVFLESFKNPKTKRVSYQVIENSSLAIEDDLLKKMRSISKSNR
jgi:hypothetical protein